MDSFVREFYKTFRKTWFPYLGFFLLLIVSLSFVKLSSSGFETNLTKARMIHPTNKLMKSSAQYAILCAQPGDAKTLSETIIRRIGEDPTLSIIVKAMVELQFTHGLRISEALNMSYSDLLPANRIRIKSLKGSIQRIIVFNDSYGYFNFCRKTHAKPFDGISRFCIYRIYKKLGIMYKDSTSSYMSITHAPRHILAAELQKSDKENAYTSDFLRHKSKESLKHYKA
jgi:integrase